MLKFFVTKKYVYATEFYGRRLDPYVFKGFVGILKVRFWVDIPEKRLDWRKIKNENTDH